MPQESLPSLLILFENKSILSNILPVILLSIFGFLIYPKLIDLLFLFIYQKNTIFRPTIKYNNEYNSY
jgi:hypothetical protein